MILHKFVTSPFNTTTLQQSLARINKNDAVVLMEDAVYALQLESLLSELNATTNELYILNTDASARGLDTTNFNTMDYEGLVDLVVKYDNVIAW